MSKIYKILPVIIYPLMPTIVAGTVSVIYHGNFNHINPYAWDEYIMEGWVFATTAMLFWGIVVSISAVARYRLGLEE